MIANRTDLISALVSAAEIEHGVCCQYLFAAFSLKVRPEEGGVTPEEIEQARDWKTTLLLIARQEMAHLGYVADLLSAVGGAPHFARPGFPFMSPHYARGIPLQLQPFGRLPLEQFICLERPRHISPADGFCRSLQHLSRGTPGAHVAEGQTLGELYDRIREAIGRLPARRLFVGVPADQVSNVSIGLPQTGFYDMRDTPITSRATAMRALDQIVEEGEGTRTGARDPADLAHCHYGRLLAIRGDYLAAQRRARRARRRYEPARPVVRNPVALLRADDGQATPITNERTREAAQLFDAVYETLIMFLVRVYSRHDEAAHLFRSMRTAAFWPLMTMCVRPLGEALTELPATPGRGGPAAGPAFHLTPAIHVVPDGRAALRVFSERLEMLAGAAERLAWRRDRSLKPHLRARLDALALDLARISVNFRRQAGIAR